MGHTITPAMYKLSYDVNRDFAPISLATAAPNILVVHTSLPVKTVGELIALAKKRPGELNFSSSGSGTAPHLSAELFKMTTKIDLVRVPFGAFLDDPDAALNPYVKGSPNNWGRFSNPALDDLYSRQARTLDPAERRKHDRLRACAAHHGIALPQRQRVDRRLTERLEDHRRPGVEAAQRRGGVAVDEDAVLGGVHLLEPDR